MASLSFSGIASGLDTQALIDATTNASRQSKVKPSQTRVTELTSTNTAFDELSTKLETLQTNLRKFTSLEGGGVSKTGTSSKESVISATATAAASNASYSVTVNALASNHTYSFDTTYSDTTSAIQSSLTGGEPEADRTVTFTVGTGTEQETVSVVVTDGSYTVQNYVKTAPDYAKATSGSTKASPAVALAKVGDVSPVIH